MAKRNGLNSAQGFGKGVVSLLEKIFSEAPPLIFFAVLAAAAWWKPLFSGKALFYDLLYKLFFPNQEFLRKTILSGSFPFWNPHIYSGVPFAANLQSAVFYPFTYVYLLLDYPWTIVLNTWAHTALAGYFMYRMAREMGLSKAAGLLSGILFSLNGSFLLRYSFPSNFHSYVWLPLLILAGLKKELALWQACLLGAGALSMQFFAGHPAFIFYGTGAYLICALFSDDPVRWLKILTGSGIGFLALSAIQWIPFLAFSTQSVRAKGFGRDWAMASSIPPREMLKMLLIPQWNCLFSPQSGDPHVVSFYFGPFALIASAFALRKGGRNWVPFAVLTVLGILLALGKHFPLYPWLYRHFSPIRSMRFPAQALYLSCFALPVLAGLGMDRMSFPRKIFLPLLTLADLLLFGWRGNVLIDPAVYRTSPPSAKQLVKAASLDRILLTPHTRYTLRAEGRGEADAWLNFKNVLYPNFPMAYGLYAADGQEEMRYAGYEEILDRIDQDPLSPWIDIFGVRYLLSYWGLPGKFQLVSKDPFNVFLNPRAFPKAYFASSAVQVPDEKALDYIDLHGSDSLRTSIILPEKVESIPPCSSKKAPSLHILDYQSQSAAIRVENDCPGWLALTDVYDPGWKALVNGSPVPILRANRIQRAVRISAGASRVDFIYRPSWLLPAAALSFLSWIFAICLAVHWARSAKS